jgi:hypothetical protein
MDRYSYFTLVTPRLADTLTIGVEAVFLKRKQPRLRRLFQVGAEGLEPYAPATHGCEPCFYFSSTPNARMAQKPVPCDLGLGRTMRSTLLHKIGRAQLAAL